MAVSVSELTQAVQRQLEESPDLQGVTVLGEVSNLTRHRSGHVYFTLKDSDAQLSAVLFRQSAARSSTFATGDLVEATGSVRVYAPRGQYQLVATRVQPAGQGALHQQFLHLKAKLEAAGLFDARHKKPLPPYPECIAVVTSPTGAVWHDITQTLARRYRSAVVHLVPAPVQGSGAAPKIEAALGRAAGISGVEAIILARGGGSIEDLWPFNDEHLAHAVFQCPVPVVSAVGHETDFTLVDFVADLRAPTPTAAAELVAPNAEMLLGELTQIQRQLHRQTQFAMQNEFQGLDEIELRFGHVFQTALQTEQRKLENLKERLLLNGKQLFAQERQRLALLEAQLNGLDAEKVLARGFALVEQDGKWVRRKKAARDQLLEIRFQDGTLTAKPEPPAL